MKQKQLLEMQQVLGEISPAEKERLEAAKQKALQQFLSLEDPEDQTDVSFWPKKAEGRRQEAGGRIYFPSAKRVTSPQRPLRASPKFIYEDYLLQESLRPPAALRLDDFCLEHGWSRSCIQAVYSSQNHFVRALDQLDIDCIPIQRWQGHR